MNKVIKVDIVKKYLIALKFDDGFSGEIDLKPFLGKGIAKHLLEKDKFQTLVH